MKKWLFIFLPAALVFTVIVQKRYFDNHYTIATVQSDIPGISCGPANYNVILPDENGKYITLLPGWGNHSYTITTNSDSAQVYFDQGLTMYYSYHPREAMASFKEAARFDSSCTMAYWGQALAKGPPYNFGHQYVMDKNIFGIISLMNKYVTMASAREKDLVAAMNRRYDKSDIDDKDRKAHNIAYAAALKQLISRYSNDNDIKSLYTDAMMLIHPWDFWYNNGEPKPWTMELIQYTRNILSEDPHHPAALHYFIHLTEASHQPGVALQNADSLKKLFPSVAHMVHMASHEYERSGYYMEGVDVNQKADSNVVQYSNLTKGLIQSVHVPHYDAVSAYCALSGGMYTIAMEKAMECRSHVNPDARNTYQQYLYMFPYFPMVRSGKWQNILSDSTYIANDWTYAKIIRDFARGMAYARSKNIPDAVKCLEQLKHEKNDTILRIPFTPYMSSPFECASIAEHILAATIFSEQKNYPAAIKAFELAIKAEDGLLYTEPKIWMLPARQYLGALLLQIQQPAKAEKIYRDDIRRNPGNGWSLLGLYQSLQQQQKTTELFSAKQGYTQSFAHADAVPAASVY
ncbi:MAG: hypothetical protein QM668_11820 [Agriterribacter sp.]